VEALPGDKNDPQEDDVVASGEGRVVRNVLIPLGEESGRHGVLWCGVQWGGWLVILSFWSESLVIFISFLHSLHSSFLPGRGFSLVFL